MTLPQSTNYVSANTVLNMGFDDLKETGRVGFAGCTPLENDGIQIIASEAFDDDTPSQCVLLECHGGAAAFAFRLDVDKAEALAKIILSAAKNVRKLTRGMQE